MFPGCTTGFPLMYQFLSYLYLFSRASESGQARSHLTIRGLQGPPWENRKGIHYHPLNRSNVRPWHVGPGTCSTGVNPSGQHLFPGCPHATPQIPLPHSVSLLRSGSLLYTLLWTDWMFPFLPPKPCLHYFDWHWRETGTKLLVVIQYQKVMVGNSTMNNSRWTTQKELVITYYFRNTKRCISS